MVGGEDCRQPHQSGAGVLLIDDAEHPAPKVVRVLASVAPEVTVVPSVSSISDFSKYAVIVINLGNMEAETRRQLALTIPTELHRQIIVLPAQAWRGEDVAPFFSADCRASAVLGDSPQPSVPTSLRPPATPSLLKRAST